MTYHHISFSQFRESYRLFFAYVLESSIAEGSLLSEPADTERYIVEHQLDLFAPLFNPADPKLKAFLGQATELEGDSVRSQVFAGIDMDHFNFVYNKVVAPSEPGMIGCHYRSIGLNDLRNSSYLATAAYWRNLRNRGAKLKGGRGYKDRHLDRMLEIYFKLFDKPKTVNQQIFNTNHPLGPIGLVFEVEDEARTRDPGLLAEIEEDQATLVLDGLFNDLGFDLVGKLLAGLKYENNDLGFLPYILGESLEGKNWEQYRQQVKESRLRLAKTIYDNRKLRRRWRERVVDFFQRRLPRNDLAEIDSPKAAKTSIQDALEMFQGCLFYGALTGKCIYTFPTSMQLELPTCGYTLMTRLPLAPSSLDFLQHVSEMIYGELFGNTVLRLYRRSFRASLHSSASNRSTPLKLLADENANLVLTATLADTPIPIEAVNNFFALVSRLPQISIYERKSYSYFLALVHHDFLESYLDRLKMNALAKRRGPAMIDEAEPGWQRDIHEYFYGDEVSIELASHGMRINVGERSAPGNALFFVYPPFDREIVKVSRQQQKLKELYGSIGKTPRFLKKLLKAHDDAEKAREAVILSDIVPIEHLKESQRLQYIYARHFGGDLKRDGDLDSLAEALTHGNHEILVLIYETNRDMKMYHGGSLVLESQFARWALPARRGDEFLGKLNDLCGSFLGNKAQGTLLCRGLIDFTKQSSRRRKGVFLVFHRGAKPEQWESLDVAGQDRGKRMAWNLEEGFGTSRGQLWGFLAGASVADGAIVFCFQDGAEDLEIHTKIRITIQGELDADEHKSALIMKGLQAREDYPELRSFGTKHSAAYEYAMSQENGFAIVVSDDGPVTLFYPEKLRRPKPPLKNWFRRVGIARM